jgi:hypothetical protein
VKLRPATNCRCSVIHTRRLESRNSRSATINLNSRLSWHMDKDGLSGLTKWGPLMAPDAIIAFTTSSLFLNFTILHYYYTFAWLAQQCLDKPRIAPRIFHRVQDPILSPDPRKKGNPE